MKLTANSLAEAAPTLNALRKLPMEYKSRLLLARLEKIGRHDNEAERIYFERRPKGDGHFG